MFTRRFVSLAAGGVLAAAAALAVVSGSALAAGGSVSQNVDCNTDCCVSLTVVGNGDFCCVPEDVVTNTDVCCPVFSVSQDGFTLPSFCILPSLVIVTQPPTEPPSATPFESIGGETATPFETVEGQTATPVATTPPTSTSGPGGTSAPLMALLISLAFGALGLLAVETQRRHGSARR